MNATTSLTVLMPPRAIVSPCPTPCSSIHAASAYACSPTSRYVTVSRTPAIAFSGSPTGAEMQSRSAYFSSPVAKRCP